MQAHPARDHIERVFSLAGNPSLAQDDPILRSWLRCLNDHRLSPEHPARPPVLEGARLREHREPMQPFLRVARPTLEQLHSRLSGLGYVVLLTDAQGVVLDAVVNPLSATQAARAGLCAGANWAESLAGTSAVGTCLIERRPIICHHTDHFHSSQISLSCSGYPLCGADGRLLGALVISTLGSAAPRESQQLALQLLAMHADAILRENAVAALKPEPHPVSLSISAVASPPVSNIAPALSSLAGNDPAMGRLLEQASRLAGKRLPLLIEGETGAGKEVLARALHQAGPRADKPFVAINCAALPESLIESELFGYAPGSFTGARQQGMAGLLEQASGGTLFLDEIGDMPQALQTRLLRVLSEREVVPLGARKARKIDIDVISATHRSLPGLVRDGKFREDLYYRLCGARLVLPPLRERHDLAFLIERIFNEESRAQGGGYTLAENCLTALRRHDWPGNLRQLRNVLRAALALSHDGVVQADDLPDELRHTAASMSGSCHAGAVQPGPVLPATPEHEREHLLQALQASHWCIARTARRLGVCRSTVYRRMQRWALVPPNRFM